LCQSENPRKRVKTRIHIGYFIFRLEVD
jgi:hypothetical protein